MCTRAIFDWSFGRGCEPPMGKGGIGVGNGTTRKSVGELLETLHTDYSLSALACPQF